MDKIIFSGIMLISVFISSVSQIMLKKASERTYDNKIKEYLNMLVAVAYFLFLISTLITILTLRYLPLSFAPVLESTGYIFVLVLSYFFLQERFRKKQVIGMMMIVCGIIIYSMDFIN